MFSEFYIIFPALTAGILILVIHVPLGIEIIRRGVVFIDLPIAQLAAMGALFGMIFFHELEGTFAHLVIIHGLALLSAFAGSLLFMYIEKYHPKTEFVEAFIGCVFVLSATLILLVLGQSAHVGDHLKDVLAGELLFVTWSQVGLLGIMVALSAFIMYRFRNMIFFGKYFYLFIAFFITISVKIAGIYLVFATLMFPGVAVYYVTQYKKKLLWGYIGSFIALIGGLLFSYFLDLATGPAIVWSIALTMFVIFYIKHRAFIKASK